MARRPGRIFVLSPAHCGGERARLVLGERAGFDLARRVRDGSGAPLGEVFSFLSGLYFRGKLAYARAFARPTGDHAGVYVITPTEGLRLADEPVDLERLRGFARVDIASRRSALPGSARSGRASSGRSPGRGRRSRPPRQHRDRQVRRSAPGCARRAPAISGRLRRARRHEPRRPPAPLRPGGHRARLRRRRVTLSAAGRARRGSCRRPVRLGPRRRAPANDAGQGQDGRCLVSRPVASSRRGSTPSRCGPERAPFI